LTSMPAKKKYSASRAWEVEWGESGSANELARTRVGFDGSTVEISQQLRWIN